uniref:Bbp19-like phage domain-containing protein n=1 Tax=uncultured Elusimicrobia bacterium TaxID=699876 RepID=A0A650F3W0_9BACT|nr:hypothetical protein Elusimicrob1349_1150 [uncultured Elusimicrobia bacterium]
MTKKEKYELKKMLGSREFRAFVFRIINACQTFRHGFIPGDPNAAAFTEGQRSIGLMLFDNLMETDPKAYLQMREEYFERLRAEQQKTEDKINQK